MYSEAGKKAVLKHRRTRRKSVSLEYKLEEYENIVLPASKASGLPVATFIKAAVQEKIQRDHPEILS